MAQTYRIAELAEEFNVSTRTLRFYESQGLLAPARQGSTRLYSERDRTRLRLALRGKRIGFSLEECKTIIDMYDSSKIENQAQLTALLDKITAHRSALLKKLADIQATLETMEQVQKQCLSGFGPTRRSPRTASDDG